MNDELQARAADYAAVLKPGDEILDETDGPYVEPFRWWLPAALCARGLHLERRPGAWVVRDAK